MSGLGFVGSGDAARAEAEDVRGQLFKMLGLEATLTLDEKSGNIAAEDGVGDGDGMQAGQGDAAALDEPGDREVSEEAEQEPLLEDSVGFKMLERMGWKNGSGLGKMKNGIIDPISACNATVYGRKGAGLCHVTEVRDGEDKKPEQMESWEREEKTEDWFKGSKSSMWLPAGLLQDQRNNFDYSTVSSAAIMTQYEDAWDDRLVSEMTERGQSHADCDWEETWDQGLEMDLDNDSLNAELFFSYTVVLGSRVRLLQIEPTGEVFQHMLWASDSASLRAVVEKKLHDKLRVMRPIIRGEGEQTRSIFGVLSKSGKGPMNREAERIQGVRTKLFGSMWLICRTRGRYVRDYNLTDYANDFLQ